MAPPPAAHRDRCRRSLLATCAWTLYDALVAAAVWLVLVPLGLLRPVTRRSSTRELRERLALGNVPPPKSSRMVVHAVSAGEMASAALFVRAFTAAHPEWSVVISFGNDDGRTVARALQREIPAIDAVVALPWDRRRAMRRWLASLHASAVAIVEPEIWPNLLRACAEERVPAFLLNARLYPRDVGRYRLARGWFADVLRHAAWIGVQNERERDHYAAIGAPSNLIEVTGALKFDLAPPPSGGDAQWIQALRRDRRLLVVAGSTHPDDEEALLEAFGQWRKRHPGVRLILAPRHAARARRVLQRVRAHGWKGQSASDCRDACWDLLVIDRLGALASLYALADVAFVGGTIARRGGHNVLEPARLGRAVVVGPHLEHIADIVDGLERDDAIVRLRHASAASLATAVAALLDDDARRRAVGERALRHCRQHSGATGRSVDAVIARLRDAEAERREAAIPAAVLPLAPSATWPLAANGAAWSPAAANPHADR